MRIAIVNSSRRRVGGVETYIESVGRGLHEAGHEVALLAEVEGALDRPPIALPPGALSWRVDELGREGALSALRAWAPDLVYTQAVEDPALEAALLDLAPCVLYAHGYYGTCISGLKTTRVPEIAQCNRVFGAACLAHYFPRRCGGSNPFTMWGLYQLQSARSRLLPRYRRVLTASERMRSEFERNGVAPGRALKLRLPATPDAAETPAGPAPGGALELLFLGRMDWMKGGLYLLDALPEVQAALGRPVHAVFAGDGPGRGEWEARATDLADAGGKLRFDFAGWVGSEARERLLAAADLLVVPSVWSEPFGMVGPEAGALGVPAAAFDIGGISEWLHEGVNGSLAPASPPTAKGLAAAIVRCVADPVEHARLREGARQVAAQFTHRLHFAGLTEILEAVVEEARGAMVAER